MPDGVIKLGISGEDDGFGASAGKAVDQLNRVTAAQEAANSAAKDAADLRKQLAQLEAADKKEAFDRLPIEEKRNRLLERRTEIQKKLAELEKHPTAANENARLGYQVAARINNRELENLNRSPGEHNGPGGETLKEAVAEGLKEAGRELLPALGVAEIIRQIKDLFSRGVEFANQIADSASRLAVTTDTAQAVLYAGGKTRLGEDQISQSYKSIELAQGRATEGDRDAINAFKAFGFLASDLQQLRPDEIFERMAQNIRDGSAAGASLQQSQELLGRGANEVINAFRSGFADALDEIRNSGGIVDKETIAELHEASEQFKVFGVLLMAQIIPAIAAVTRKLTEWLPILARLADQSLPGNAGRLGGDLVGGAKPMDALFDFAARTRMGRFISSVAGFVADKKVGDTGPGALTEIADKSAEGAAKKKSAAEEKSAKIAEDRAKAEDLRKRADENDLESPGSGKPLRQEAQKLEDEANLLETGKDRAGERQARQAELNKKLAEVEKAAKFEAMGPYDQIKQLQKDRAKILADAAGPGTDEALTVGKTKAADISKQIAALTKSLPQAQIPTDQLARVGLFRGGAGGDQHLRVAQQQLQEAQRAARTGEQAAGYLDAIQASSAEISRHTVGLKHHEN